MVTPSQTYDSQSGTTLSSPVPYSKSKLAEDLKGKLPPALDEKARKTFPQVYGWGTSTGSSTSSGTSSGGTTSSGGGNQTTNVPEGVLYNRKQLPETSDVTARNENIRVIALRNAQSTIERIQSGSIISSSEPFGYGISSAGFGAGISVTKENLDYFKRYISPTATTNETPRENIGMFGGGYVSPGETNVFSRAGMLAQTTAQSTINTLGQTYNKFYEGINVVGKYKVGNFQTINEQLKYLQFQAQDIYKNFKSPIEEGKRQLTEAQPIISKQIDIAVDYGSNIYTKQLLPELKIPIAMYKQGDIEYQRQKEAQILFQPELKYVLPPTLAEAGIVAGSVYGAGLLGGNQLLIGTQALFSKQIAEGTSNFIDSIIPRQDSGFNLYGSPAQIGRGLLYAGSTPFTGIAFMKEIGTGLLTEPALTIKQFKEYAFLNPYEVTTIGLATPYAQKVYGTSFFAEKPYQVELSKALQKEIEPFTRKSARLFLTDETGKYILGKAGGEYISIGGGIKKGQTPRTAIISELKQETGLTLRDISNFKFKSKIVFPEETMNIFTAKIKDINKIKAGSDISKIKLFSPNNIFLKDVTGQTALQPVSRISLNPFEFGRVRSYEAGIINYLEKGIKPTALAVETDLGTYFLGTQSRYNVPYSSQKQFLNADKLLLAHGTTTPAVLNRFGIIEKEFKVNTKNTRGSDAGLFVHPPISPKTDLGYIGLSYLGFKTSQMEKLGLKIGYPRRTALLFKEEANKLSRTSKTLKGAEEEFIIKPLTRISTAGESRIASIGLKRVYLQPAKIVEESTKEFKDSGIVLRKSSSGNYKFISPESLTSFVNPSKSFKIFSSPLRKKSSSFERSFSSSSLKSFGESYKPSSSTTSITKSLTFTKVPSSFSSSYNRIGIPPPSVPRYTRDDNGFRTNSFLYYGEQRKKRRKTKYKRKSKEDLALTPSFTAQMLRLTKTIKLKDLSKELKKFRTGAEYRPYLRVIK